jgi:hypothetical protein
MALVHKYMAGQNNSDFNVLEGRGSAGTRQNAGGQGFTGTVRKDRLDKVLVCSKID